MDLTTARNLIKLADEAKIKRRALKDDFARRDHLKKWVANYQEELTKLEVAIPQLEKEVAQIPSAQEFEEAQKIVDDYEKTKKQLSKLQSRLNHIK